MNCPACSAAGAYVGFTAVECVNPTCKHFKKPEELLIKLPEVPQFIQDLKREREGIIAPRAQGVELLFADRLNERVREAAMALAVPEEMLGRKRESGVAKNSDSWAKEYGCAPPPRTRPRYLLRSMSVEFDRSRELEMPYSSRVAWFPPPQCYLNIQVRLLRRDEDDSGPPCDIYEDIKARLER